MIRWATLIYFIVGILVLAAVGSVLNGQTASGRFLSLMATLLLLGFWAGQADRRSR